MNRILIVGLGPGDPAHLTRAACDALQSAGTIWVRTANHPAVAALPPHLTVKSCDDIYMREARFDDAYKAIADRLVDEARTGPVTYAVPGDPSVGEATVGHLRRLTEEGGGVLEVVPGVSFLGPTLSVLGWDALDGLQIADATAMAQQHYPLLDPDRPALVAQVYSRLVASDLKLVLLSLYPPTHPVTLVRAAGTSDGVCRAIGLESLDRQDVYGDLTTVAVPPLPKMGSLAALAELVAHLRAPDGCPWDREQTHSSLRPFLLEETYEALAALDAGNTAALREELGDLLLQIVLHAQLAVEAGDFSLADVIGSIADKLVRRHPHVFGSGTAETAEDVRQSWDALKRSERRADGQTDPFADVPTALPALARAQLVQRNATGSTGDPVETVAAVAALEQAAAGGDRARLVGEALWSVTAAARAWGIDAETALRDVIERYQLQAR